jgi:hypothetical protein
MKPFVEFIRSCRITDSPRGNFLADTKTLISCNKMPTIRCWGQLYGFMSARHARPETIAEARKVWKRYQKSISPEDIQ